MNPFATTSARQRVQAKRDRLRSRSSDAKAKAVSLSAEVDAVRGEILKAVEIGDPAAQKELTAKLSRLNADLDANRTLGEITESALAAAEKELSDLLAAERLERAASVLAETEKALGSEREALGPAFVPFVEARGRVTDLEDRLSRLRREYLALGGRNVARPGDGDAPARSSVELAYDAARAKYGDRVRIRPNEDTRALGAIVSGLAGPEPEI